MLRFLFFSASIFISFAVASCNKAEQYMNTAEVSVDNRLAPCLPDDTCDCPGGLFVSIDNVSSINGQPFKATIYPTNFSYTPPFPIAVKIDWKYDSIPCGSNSIIITKIARQ